MYRSCQNSKKRCPTTNGGASAAFVRTATPATSSHAEGRCGRSLAATWTCPHMKSDFVTAPKESPSWFNPGSLRSRLTFPIRGNWLFSLSAAAVQSALTLSVFDPASRLQRLTPPASHEVESGKPIPITIVVMQMHSFVHGPRKRPSPRARAVASDSLPRPRPRRLPSLEVVLWTFTLMRVPMRGESTRFPCLPVTSARWQPLWTSRTSSAFPARPV